MNHIFLHAKKEHAVLKIYIFYDSIHVMYPSRCALVGRIDLHTFLHKEEMVNKNHLFFVLLLYVGLPEDRATFSSWSYFVMIACVKAHELVSFDQLACVG